MRLVLRACGEVKRIRDPSSAAVSKAETPKAVDDDRVIVNALQQTAKSSARAEGHNRTAAEIAHQELTGVFTEGVWSQRQTPRGIEKRQIAASVSTGRKAVERCGRGIKDIDDTVSPSFN